MKKYKLLFHLINFLFILHILSCAINPVTGKKELMLYSEEGEIALGKKADMQIKSSYGLYYSNNLDSYIQMVADKITPHTHRPHLKYYFATLDTPTVNAFAIPGGYVYLTRGILAMINSEAELATIIGHELGHINAKHSLRKMSGMLFLNLGLAVGSALDEDFAKMSGLANLGIQLLFLKFSRQDEFQADSLGINYARAAGYSPGEMINFFNALQQMKVVLGATQLPSFLSTHPLTKNRIMEAQNMLTPQDTNRMVNQNQYLSKLQGMIFGDNLRHGFFKENIFYHPNMAFTFTCQKGWKTQNTPKQVIISEANGNAAIILSAERSNQDLNNYLNQQLKSLNIQQNVSLTREYINQYNAINGIYDIITDSSTHLRIMVNCIKKGPYIFTFLSLAKKEYFSTYYNNFQSAVGSFAPLNDNKILSIKPKRIKIIKANGTRTLKHYFKSYNIQGKQWNYLSLINRKKLSDVPKKGSFIKIIK